MTTFHCAGLDRESRLPILQQEGAAAMVGASALLNASFRAALLASDVPFVVDSEYKKKVTLHEYARLIISLEEEAPGRIGWYASYDQVGKMEESTQNYFHLLKLLPSHIHPKIRWILQCPAIKTQRQRQRIFDHLESMLSTWRPIGIGGLIPHIKDSPAQTFDFLQQLGEILSRWQIPAHVFGVTAPQFVYWLQSQIWCESLDSSKWLAAWFAFEVLRLNGEQRKARHLLLPLKKEECAAIIIRVIHSWCAPGGILESLQCSFSNWDELLETDGADQDEDNDERWGIVGGIGMLSQKELSQFLVRHRARELTRYSLAENDATCSVYVPLHVNGTRECGLLCWSSSTLTDLRSDAQWCVVWSVDPDDPPLPKQRLFHLAGRLMTGLFSHDDIYFPALCHFPLSLAFALARSLSPA